MNGVPDRPVRRGARRCNGGGDSRRLRPREGLRPRRGSPTRGRKRSGSQGKPVPGTFGGCGYREPFQCRRMVAGTALSHDGRSAEAPGGACPSSPNPDRCRDGAAGGRRRNPGAANPVRRHGDRRSHRRSVLPRAHPLRHRGGSENGRRGRPGAGSPVAGAGGNRSGRKPHVQDRPAHRHCGDERLRRRVAGGRGHPAHGSPHSGQVRRGRRPPQEVRPRTYGRHPDGGGRY